MVPFSLLVMTMESVFEKIRDGLEEAIAYERGEIEAESEKVSE